MKQYSTAQIYDARTIFFHWLAAFLIFGMWALGQGVDAFPRGEPRDLARSVHIVTGVLLALVILARLAWRFTGGVRLAPADSGVLGKLATSVHHILYLLMIATVVLGIYAAKVRGDTLFGAFTIPALEGADRALRRAAVGRHELAANLLFFIALFHAAAALWHHYVAKDTVLIRMRPGLKPRA